MAEVINLRMARKARDRKAANQQAEANRAKHGQPLAVTRLHRAESERAANRLDRLRLERGDDRQNEKPDEA